MKIKEKVKEHPDDKKGRIESERLAAKYGVQLTNERMSDLRKLLTTYSDADAENLLWNLREWFWGHALPFE